MILITRPGHISQKIQIGTNPKNQVLGPIRIRRNTQLNMFLLMFRVPGRIGYYPGPNNYLKIPDSYVNEALNIDFTCISLVNVWSFYVCATVTKSRWNAFSNMEEGIDIRDQILLIFVLWIFLWVLIQTFNSFLNFFVCSNDRLFFSFEMLDLFFVWSLFNTYFI